MSRQESNSHYRDLHEEEESKEPKDAPQPEQHKSKMWILYSITATICFAVSAYVLGMISVGGVSAKFLSSYGYLIIGVGIAFSKNIRFSFERHQLFKRHPEERKTKSLYASLKDSCFYDKEKEEYNYVCLTLSFICGLFNLAGEFCVVLAFKHALDAYMNQGILTAIFTLGAIAVLLGSVFILKEHVKLCEYFGMALIIAGVIVISLSKKGSDVDLGGLEPIFDKFAAYLPIEGPETAIILMVAGALCFGFRGLTLKYMGIVHGIDGISASSIFLMTDGIIGGVIGLVVSVGGGGFAAFPAKNIVLGVFSGCFAGIGVVFINKAIMEGVAGPAVAVANLSSVIQALLDWLLLGQTPSAVEIVGLIVALGGAIFMAIGDDYIIAPLSRDNKNKLPKDVHVDMEVGCSGEYKSPEIKSDSAAKKTQNFNDKKKFLEGEMSKPVNSNGKMSDTNIDSKIPNGNSVPSAPTNPQVENPKQEELHAN